jgi:hypothetical protein
MQHLKTLPENRCVMDEDILAAFLTNEPESPGVVPPFHFAACHISLPNVERAGDKKQKTPDANSAGVRRSFFAPHTPRLTPRIARQPVAVKEYVYSTEFFSVSKAGERCRNP